MAAFPPCASQRFFVLYTTSAFCKILVFSITDFLPLQSENLITIEMASVVKTYLCVIVRNTSYIAVGPFKIISGTVTGEIR